MKFDFTTIYDRRGRDAMAVDAVEKIPVFQPNEGFDAIPMWVADMNFATAPAVTEAIRKRLEHPLFGYFMTSDEYFDSIIRWQQRRNGVTGLEKEHIGYENGVLGGLMSALAAVCARGDNVLVHRDFAMQNGLSVGSTFRLRQEGRNATVRVAGIFSGNVQAQSPLPSDTSENLIYSGRRVASALTGNDQIGMIRCLSDNPQDLSAAVSQAKTMAGGKYDVTDDSARLSGVLQSVQTVRNLVRMVLLSVCLADVLVLAMALVFWIRSRIHEIGTLLALGIGKMRIVAQLAIETGLMAVVAALCSLGTGAMLSGYVSSRLLRDSGVAPLESLHVEALPPEQTLLILLLGCAVIAIALAVSCAAVLAKSPKSILSSMR